MKEKHLKILEKFVRTKNDGVDMNSEYLQISVSSALSAMAVLQSEIDALRRDNERLKEQMMDTGRNKCDWDGHPDIYDNDEF